MARIRQVKPTFFTNEELPSISPIGRLLFIGLWTIADREGRLEDRPLRIRAELFPYENIKVERLLSDLAEHGFIKRYTVEGRRIIQIQNFARHQHPHPNEPASVLPLDNGDPVPDSERDNNEPTSTNDLSTYTNGRSPEIIGNRTQAESGIRITGSSGSSDTESGVRGTGKGGAPHAAIAANAASGQGASPPDTPGPDPPTAEEIAEAEAANWRDFKQRTAAAGRRRKGAER